MKESECERVIEHLSEYLDAELGEGLSNQIEAHLAECAECEGKLRTMRSCIEALVASPEERLSPTARRNAIELLKVIRTKLD